MSDFAPELKRLLREAGCYFVRSGKGDHEIWFSPTVGRNVTVDSKIKSRRTAMTVAGRLERGPDGFDQHMTCIRVLSRAARQRALSFAARIRLFCALACLSNCSHSSGGLPLLSMRRNVR